MNRVKIYKPCQLSIALTNLIFICVQLQFEVEKRENTSI